MSEVGLKNMRDYCAALFRKSEKEPDEALAENKRILLLKRIGLLGPKS